MAGRYEKNYTVQPGQYGTVRLIQSGRAAADNVAAILAGTSDGELVAIPHVRGVRWKSFDGTNPKIKSITPATMNGQTFQCVKVSASATPLAAQQVGGAFAGQPVVQYEIVWQQIGDV